MQDNYNRTENDSRYEGESKDEDILIEEDDIRSDTGMFAPLKRRFNEWEDGLSTGQLSTLAKVLAAISAGLVVFNIVRLVKNW